MLDSLIAKGFQVEFHSHAKAILSVDFPDAIAELETALDGLTIPIEEIIGGGGGETKGTQRLRRALASVNWIKTNFTVEKIINGVKKESQSHEVDHVRRFSDGRIVALEIEWNNKDPFFDRDLENFKRLHAEGAISAGVIVKRGTTLQAEMIDLVERFAISKGLAAVADLIGVGLNPTKRQKDMVEARVSGAKAFPRAWAEVFVSDKYGQATTHWRKLEDRVQRGVGNPCPLVLIGLPASLVTFGEPAVVVEELLDEAEEEAAAEAAAPASPPH